MDIYDAIHTLGGIEHILVRHEQAAVHMADGYARATGKVGCVLVTSGPGATNAITGILTAYTDSVPVSYTHLIHIIAQHLQQHWLNPIQGCYRFHFDETTLDLWFGDVAKNLPELGDYMNGKIAGTLNGLVVTHRVAKGI